MAQLSLAVALISGLSVAGLGAGLTLLREKEFILIGWWKCAFGVSQLFFVLAAFLSSAAVITRLLSFRLTARKVRNDEEPGYSRSLIIFGCDSDGYDRATWRLFWPSCAVLLLGATSLVVTVAHAYADKLH